MHTPIRYLECSCCGQFHKEGYIGDCRNDQERFTWEQIEQDKDGGMPTEIVLLDEQTRNI